ncbi:MAG TPA: thiamine phosphate synthase [Virgibacillus sp.]|nr:thiamine phosphate synthase [Virgibacillus sp.]
MELHLISSGRQTKQELVSSLIKVQSYADYIHLREKDFNFADYLEVIEKLTAANIPLGKIIINGRVDVASYIQTGGIQLGAQSLSISEVAQSYPNMYIGSSVHSTSEALEKEEAGADFLIYGHVFSTASKPNVSPRGISALQTTVQSVSIPVIAIGGIKPTNIKQVKKSGAQGIAVLSGILLAEDVQAAALAYHSALKEVI